mmetsp:Transcript_7922/g.22696  ORF Transcript_7922/g.22696 Transcript_7922/m.22696 type:complete len:219 (-) Transcript_7922:635-1291(-)
MYLSPLPKYNSVTTRGGVSTSLLSSRSCRCVTVSCSSSSRPDDSRLAASSSSSCTGIVDQVQHQLLKPPSLGFCLKALGFLLVVQPLRLLKALLPPFDCLGAAVECLLQRVPGDIRHLLVSPPPLSDAYTQTITAPEASPPAPPCSSCPSPAASADPEARRWLLHCFRRPAAPALGPWLAACGSLRSGPSPEPEPTGTAACSRPHGRPAGLAAAKPPP